VWLLSGETKTLSGWIMPDSRRYNSNLFRPGGPSTKMLHTGGEWRVPSPWHENAKEMQRKHTPLSSSFVFFVLFFWVPNETCRVDRTRSRLIHSSLHVGEVVAVSRPCFASRWVEGRPASCSSLQLPEGREKEAIRICGKKKADLYPQTNRPRRLAKIQLMVLSCIGGPQTNRPAEIRPHGVSLVVVGKWKGKGFIGLMYFSKMPNSPTLLPASWFATFIHRGIQ
jgi:hypothetical protein